MLTHQQILHFSTFGYVTLHGLFSPPEMATLRDEVTSTLTSAFGQLGTKPDESGGISGDYLALSVDRAPFSQSLIADDERTFLASAELLGDQDQMRLVRDTILDGVEFGHEEYDRDRWPAWHEWAAGAARSPSRTLAVERLRLLGVLAG